jgi:DNA-binding Lrp family transcriptional regulator
MDELDKKIIGELQESYSLTPKVTDIAKRLGKSSTTVHSRIKRLERSGVIKGYGAEIEQEKIGRNLNAFYFIKTTRGGESYKADAIAEELAKNPNVRRVYNTMGEWDLMVEFVGKDSDDYYKFMKKTEPLKGIKDTKGKYVLKTYPSKFKFFEK